MILNISKIKTEAVLLFCRDLIQAYSKSDENIFSINKELELYVYDTVTQLEKAINQVVHQQQHYLDNRQNFRIKSVLKSYDYINSTISEYLSKGQKFNPAMLCFSLLTTWFAELRYESNSKEFIYFTIYPYGNFYDKLLLNLNNDEYKALNISMIKIAEDAMIKLHKVKLQ